MNLHELLDDPPAEARHPRLVHLRREWQQHLRSLEHTEAKHRESYAREQALYDLSMRRLAQQTNLLDTIEGARLAELRTLRKELDKEVLAEHEVAAAACAELGLPYLPGQSTVDDVLKAVALPESEAAHRAGVQVASSGGGRGLAILKIAGMVGCFLLGMVGMGALILRIPPRMLFHSPLFSVAAGLASILVGGTYLVVAPTSLRAGALAARLPNERATKSHLLVNNLRVLLMCIVVALVDAKAIIAINGARALVDPSSAPSFAITFLVALALSAAYVVGTSTLSFAEGYGREARSMIEAEQEKHLQEQRLVLQITQAVEALNSVEVIERRRRALSAEIETADREYRLALKADSENIPALPLVSEEHRRMERFKEQEGRFAAKRLAAFESLFAKTRALSPSAKWGDER